MASNDNYFPGVYERLTVRRIQILRLLADGRTEPEIARELKIEPTTAHSSVDELRDLVDLPSGRELGRWWREFGDDWVRWIANEAGFPLPPSLAS